MVFAAALVTTFMLGELVFTGRALVLRDVVNLAGFCIEKIGET